MQSNLEIDLYLSEDNRNVTVEILSTCDRSGGITFILNTKQSLKMLAISFRRRLTGLNNNSFGDIR